MIGFLYGQTEYNMLKSSLRVSRYVSCAKEYGYHALSITDANMYGHYKFYNECIKNDIKPIIGLEFKIYSLSDDKIDKMIAYAINDNGYKELIKMSSYDKVKEHIFTIDELKKYKNVLFISGIETELIRTSSPTDLLKKYKQIENFGVGISLSYKNIRQGMCRLFDESLALGIKAYPISPTLYDNIEDYDAYEALSMINNEVPLVDCNYHYKSALEIENEFYSYEIVFKNYEEFVNKVNVTIRPVAVSLPKFPNTNNTPSSDYLRGLCEKGLQKRTSYKLYADISIYKERLNYELSVIHKMNYDDYFLIVWDYVKYAKKQGIMVGPGRGSAAGSLVSYCLGITSIDPIRFDLLFERFLNPARVSMPDIDMDFPDDKRQQVIEYTRDLYGEDHVCTISAFGTFQIKSSIRDLGRVLKLRNQDIEIISKLASEANDFDKLISDYENNPQIYKLLSVAKKIENLPRHISTHAAGIIISADPLTDKIPLQLGSTSLFQSQLEAVDLAELGLLKMDFLGIRNLTLIDNIAKCIPNMNNITIQNIPLDNEKTYRLLQDGDTDGVFQLEKEGIKKVLRKLKPTKFDDLVAVIALYRPGPMENIDEFIARKNGKAFTYLHPDLEPILKSTYGIIVYQEQIMQISYRFAKMSLGEADLLRKAVSKKDKETLDEYKKKFVISTVNAGYSEIIANQIYDYILKFANYGFNKSHSVAYAVLAYQMAYFKANYFALFMAKYLNSVISNNSLIEKNISYVRRKGINVFKPDINLSDVEFISQNNALIYPLQGINQIGVSTAKEIVKERLLNGKYSSFEDFKRRLPSLGKGIYESLIYAGAFDSFGSTKKSMLSSSSPLEDIFNNQYGADLKEQDGELSLEELRIGEKKSLGFNLEYDPFKDINYLTKNYNAKFFGQELMQYAGRAIVELSNTKEVTTKKGDKMLLGQAFDGRKELKFVIFPSSYQKIPFQIETDGLYLTFGKIEKNSNDGTYEYNIIEVKERIR